MFCLKSRHFSVHSYKPPTAWAIAFLQDINSFGKSWIDVTWQPWANERPRGHSVDGSHGRPPGGRGGGWGALAPPAIWKRWHHMLSRKMVDFLFGAPKKSTFIGFRGFAPSGKFSAAPMTEADFTTNEIRTSQSRWLLQGPSNSLLWRCCI